MLPLAGIRVLDLSRALAGPYCARMLGDLGADVIKVEDVGGDESRQWSPFANGISTLFLATNRNKRSLCVDLRTDEGRSVIQAIARQCDVLIENFRSRVPKKLGLDYPTVRPLNPRIVYCSISGFGRKGPMAEYAAYDATMQAFGGLMSCTGEVAGRAVRAGYSVADITTALLGYGSIVTALLARTTSGEGTFVETSLLDSQIAFLSYNATAFSVDGSIPLRLGTANNREAPLQVLQTKDGELMVAAPSNSMFRRLCAAIGTAELVDDPRYVSNQGRFAHRAALESDLERTLSTMSTEAVSVALLKAGVPFAPINTVAEVIESDQVRARRLIVREEHPQAGEILVPAPLLHLDRVGSRIRRHAPALGEHSARILLEFGWNRSEVAGLKRAGILIDNQPARKRRAGGVLAAV
jgi:crotonobetainyl-CoA:carnitine CoA-transferase CaiB-like acyl-CoA transferase